MMSIHIDDICLNIFGLRVITLLPSAYVKNIINSISVKT